MLKLTQMMLAARRHGQNVEEMFRAGIRPEAILLNASLAGACNLQPSTYSTILLGRWVFSSWRFVAETALCERNEALRYKN
jgi:hypothetical protein